MFDLSKRPKVAWTEATPYLVYCAIAFAFGNLLFGVDTGSFGSIQALPSFLNAYAPLGADGKRAFSTVDKSTMNSVVWPGKIFGTFMFEPLAERLGYKRTMYIVAFVQFIALIVQMTAKDWKVFTGGRVIAYAAVGVVENAAPSYISEVAPAGMRGFFGGAMVVVVTIGNLWGALMGRAYANEPRKLGYLVCVGVQFIPAVLILVLVPFCVESPRWLLSKGRTEEASKSLDRLRPHADVAAGRTLVEIEALQEAVTTQDTMDHGRWIDLFRTKGGHLRRTLVACGIFFFQQTAG
jgi:MFS family permease